MKTESRQAVYGLVRAELEGPAGVVLSSSRIEKVDLKAATEMADHLAQEIFRRSASPCCTDG